MHIVKTPLLFLCVMLLSNICAFTFQSWRRRGHFHKSVILSSPSSPLLRPYCLTKLPPYIRCSSSSSSPSSALPSNEIENEYKPLLESGKSPSTNHLLRNLLIKSCEEKDIEKARKYLKQIRETSPSKRSLDLIILFLTFFPQYENLPIALEIIDMAARLKMKPNENYYIGLIRCYADGNKMKEAWDVIEDLRRQMIPLKMRSFQPILECCRRNHDLDSALTTIGYLKSLGYSLKSDQLMIMLEIYAYLKKQNPKKAIIFRKRIDSLLLTFANKYLGLDFEHLQKLICDFTNDTREDIEEKGVLVNSIPEIDGPLIDTTTSFALQEDKEGIIRVVADASLVYALNASYANPCHTTYNITTSNTIPDDLIHSLSQSNHVTIGNIATANSETGWEEPGSSSSHNNNTSSASSAESITKDNHGLFNNVIFMKEKYRVKALQYEQLLALQPPEEGVQEAEAVPGEGDRQHALWAKTYQSSARLVQIGGTSCVCPNCAGKLAQMHISEREKLEVRDTIYRHVLKIAPQEAKHLETFAKYLKRQTAYDYIIDGPNVAYTTQNHENGRFSYKQIEVIVEKIKAMGKRPLVILPSCYTDHRKAIPNSIRTNRHFRYLYMTNKEKKFLKKLEQEGMLYSVPTSRVDDDWYAMYAAISPSRNPHAPPPYLITNDLMRDHKYSLVSSNSFMRWRNAQIVYFTMNRTTFIDFKEHPTALAKVVGKAHYTRLQEQNKPQQQQQPPQPQQQPVIIVDVDDESMMMNIAATSKEKAIVVVKEEEPIPDTAEDCEETVTVTASTSTEESVPEEDWDIPATAHFFPPGNFSRELQYSPEANRWHIPALEKNMWLCLSTDPNLD